MASPKASHHHRPGAGGGSKQKQQQQRARRPDLVLRRAMLHSCLCFLLGLVTGLAPSDWTDAASRVASSANKQVFRALHAVRQPSLSSQHPHPHDHLMLLQQQYQVQLKQQRQPQVIVVVTTTGASERERRSAGLTRTAHALRLVSPPVVWLVVEAAHDAPDTALLLRRTGVVYRHVTYKLEANFSSSSEERHHQRTLAMAHIEQHRLRGVVLFAGLADVFDLRLLEQLRRVRTFGAWPVATVWENRVAVEGPLCRSSNNSSTGGGGAVVTGWSAHDGEAAGGPRLPDVDVHGFAFSSDLLLDPDRWDRFPTSESDQSHDSINFVQRLLVRDYYNKVWVINCSEIMVWRVDTALL